MNIAGIYENSVSNGDGWRSVLFVSGCPHQCDGCQNPQTWNACYGEAYGEEKAFQVLTKNPCLTGVTISGGEPLLYYKELAPLLDRLRMENLNIWVYTGFVFEELVERAKTNSPLRTFLEKVDVLIDGRYEKHLSPAMYRGSENQRLIHVPQSLATNQVVLWEPTATTQW